MLLLQKMLFLTSFSKNSKLWTIVFSTLISMILMRATLLCPSGTNTRIHPTQHAPCRPSQETSPTPQQQVSKLVNEWWWWWWWWWLWNQHKVPRMNRLTVPHTQLHYFLPDIRHRQWPRKSIGFRVEPERLCDRRSIAVWLGDCGQSIIEIWRRS